MAEELTYWQKRANEAMQAEQLADDAVVAEIERIIKAMIADIDKEIYAFYAKYADKEGVTIEAAKKKIDQTAVEEFKAKAAEYVRNRDFSDKANAELRQYNTKMYVSREEMLKVQLAALMTYTTAKVESTLYNYMESSIYNELKRQSGLLGETVVISPNTVQAIINSAFYGVTWSEKLWKDMKAAQQQVEKVISHMLLRGRHPNEFVAETKKKLDNKSTYEVKRLLLTEATRARTEAQKLYFNEILGKDGIVEYHAKLDDRTTKLCRSMNGSKIKVKDIKPGVNAPPMHPFCRSILVETTDDWREEFFAKRKGKYSLNNPIQIGGENSLNQAKEFGKKIKITDQAIDKVKFIDIPTHSAEENKTIQLMHKQLLQDSKENNDSNEVVYFLIGDKTRVIYGNQTQVTITGDDSILLDNSDVRSIIMLHNHPGGSSFSLTDLKTLFTTNSIKTLTIVTNQGGVKYITKTEEFNVIDALKVTSEIIGSVSIEEINPTIIEILLKRLYNLGMIIFKVR